MLSRLLRLSSVNAGQAFRKGAALLVCLAVTALVASGSSSPLLAAPAAELDWQWRNPLPGNSDLHAVVFAQERFIAVGDSGTILVSRDGDTWERSTSPTTVPLNGIAYRYGRFVAVGGEWAKGHSVSLVSTDGLLWGLSKVADGNQLSGVAYGNDLFVAVGDSWTGDLGVIYTSPDGINWTMRKSGACYLREVMFDGARFIVIGEGGTFLYSANGIDWVQTTGAVQVDGVACGTGVYIGVGGTSIADPLVFCSTDLQNWTTSPLPRDAGGLRAVTYGGGQFVSVGYSGTVLTSADGLTWAQQPSGIESMLNDVAYGSGRFVAVGHEGAILSSSGPSETAGGSVWSPWTLRVAGTRQPLRGVAYGNGMFAAVGSGGRIVTSGDGVNWTFAGETETLAPWSFTGVTYGNGLFVATAMYYGFEPGVFTSKDGVDWQAVGPYPGPSYGLMARGFSSISFGNGRFVAGQQYGVTMTSLDGVKWTWDQSQPARSFTGIVYGNGQFVAAIQREKEAVILTSADGMTWTENPIAATVSPCAVAYDNGQYVAAGHDGAVYSSSDGVHWAQRRQPSGEGLRRIAFGGGMFVVVGERGTILTSRDGVAWVPNPRLTDRGLADIAYARGCFVIVGDKGTIMSAGLPDSLGLPYAYGGPAFSSFTVYHPMTLAAGTCVYPVRYFLAPSTNPARDSVEALIRGLPGTEDTPFIRLPEGTRLLSMRFEAGVCTADLSEEIQAVKTGPRGEEAVISAVVRTLTGSPGVDSVRILVGGKSIETLAGSVDVSRPLTSETIPTPAFTPFADVAHHWAGGAITSLQTTGVIGGYPDGTFRPETPVSRAEFVKMLVEALRLPPAGPSSPQPFKDTAGHWSGSCIRSAVASGLVLPSDYGDYFRPDEVIPRDEMATLLVTASGIYRDSHPEVRYEPVSSTPSFADIGLVETRHVTSVRESVRLGLLRGFPDGTFRPESGLTRAEASTTVARLLGAQGGSDILRMLPSAGFRWNGGSLLVLGAAFAAPEAGPGMRVTPTGGATILQDRLAVVGEPGWSPLGVYLDGALLADQSPASLDLFTVNAAEEREFGLVSLPLDTGQAVSGGEWREVTDEKTLAMLWDDYLYDMACGASAHADVLIPANTIPFIFRRACRDGAFAKAGVTGSDGTPATTAKIISVIQTCAKRYLGTEIDDPWIMPLGNRYGWDWLGEPPAIPPLNTRDRGVQDCDLALKSVTRNSMIGRYTAHLVRYARMTNRPFEYLTYVLEECPDGSLRFVRGIGRLSRAARDG